MLASMVLTEAVRMAEGNSSPINNILTNNSVMTAAGITPTANENTQKTNPNSGSGNQQTTLATPMLGVFEGSTTSSSRNKAPIYTRDKRTKFTQRENKKWVRLATVLGYLVAVCIPAIALSIYYIGFWTPNYGEKYMESLREKEREDAMKLQALKQKDQPQQCCVACSCPNEASTTQPSSAPSRDTRHLASVYTAESKVDPNRFPYEGMGEKAAENAYYHNVVMGKNYVIYGAADDSSPERTEFSSPQTVTPTPAAEHQSRPQHEKRIHTIAATNSQHRQHHAVPPI